MTPDPRSRSKGRDLLRSLGPKGRNKLAPNHETSNEQVGPSRASNQSPRPKRLRDCDHDLETSSPSLGETGSVLSTQAQHCVVAQGPLNFGAPSVKISVLPGQATANDEAGNGFGDRLVRRRYQVYFDGNKTPQKSKEDTPNVEGVQTGPKDLPHNSSDQDRRHSRDTPDWIDPLRCHPVECFRGSSPQALNGAAVAKLPPAATSADWNADRVKEKVYEMLAASEALKPKGQTRHSSRLGETAGIPQSVSSRMLAKFSNVWGKLHSKSNKEASKRQEHSKSMQLSSMAGIKNPRGQRASYHLQAQASGCQASLSTMELRLNEGDNLNKKKVQKIVGGHVVRKPLADDGKSLRSGRYPSDTTINSLDCPITPDIQPGHSKRTSPCEHYLMASHERVNPFESEKEFFGDLDSGLLTTLPTGCSTPRIRRAGAISTLPEDSLSETRHQRAKSANATTSLSQMNDCAPVQQHTESSPHGSLIGSIRGAEDTKSWQDLNDTSPPKRKKHPSPSKDDLELLRVALEKMTTSMRKTTREDRGMDELANPNPSTLGLAPRDPNQRLSSHRHSKSFGDNGPSEFKLAPGQFRLPRRGERVPVLNSRRRVGATWHPPNLDANEPDELI